MVDLTPPVAWHSWLVSCLWDLEVGWPIILSIGCARMISRTISQIDAELDEDIVVVVVVVNAVVAFQRYYLRMLSITYHR